jgi:hypothetical protein
MDSASNASGRSAPIQFSLRSLLFTLGFAGILLAPIRWFGGYYLISLIASLALIASCLWAFRVERRASTFGLSFLGLIGAMFIASAPLAMHAIFNSIACAICALFRLRPKVASGLMCFAMAAAYGLFFWTSAGEFRRLYALLDKYPLKSLEPRLAFEKDSARNSPRISIPDSDSRMSATVRANLASFEEQRDVGQFSRRGLALYRLHELTYQQFAIATGFGNSRMGNMHPESVDLESHDPIQMPLAASSVSLQPTSAELDKLHLTANLDFVASERMGYVRNRKQVAGFEAHALTGLPDQWSPQDRPPARWQVNRLELVSLLRHETPQVYVANELPQMDELADVPYRSLNDFEKNALPMLECDEDVVVEQQPDRILMLGAVRAAADCLRCHEGNRGKLLGAFSYELTPMDVTASSR